MILKYICAIGNLRAMVNPKYICAIGNLKVMVNPKYICAIWIALDCVLKHLFFR
jgi:hypothetical protein